MSFILKSNVGAINAQLRQRAGQLVAKTALKIETTAKLSMTGPKSGRTYGKHTASAPGEAPAIDTGFLVNSIQSELTGEMSAAVGSNAEYAPVLELGGALIAPRPWLGPAFEQAKPDFEKGLQELLK